jgi:hypothetical protein
MALSLKINEVPFAKTRKGLSYKVNRNGHPLEGDSDEDEPDSFSPYDDNSEFDVSPGQEIFRPVSGL